LSIAISSHEPEEQPPIEVDGSHLIIHEVHLNAPRAAYVLAGTSTSLWLSKLNIMVELGAEGVVAAGDSASVKLMEARVTNIFDKLDTDVAKVMLDDREAVKALLETFGASFNKAVTKVTDPNAPDAVPMIVTNKTAEVVRSAIANIDSMLNGGDNGALTQQTKEIVATFRTEMELLKKAIIERQAIHDLGAGKGKTLEEEVAHRLGIIGRPLMCEVERVGDKPGIRKTKAGDVVVSVKGAITRGTPIRIAFECKDHDVENGPFSLTEIRTSCRLAAENRSAQVTVFVVDDIQLLPEQRAFGIVDGHYFLAYTRGSDDTALAAVFHLALTKSLTELEALTSDHVDIEAARRQLQAVEDSLERFEEIESGCSAAIRSMQKVSTTGNALRSALMNGLAKLQAILIAE